VPPSDANFGIGTLEQKKPAPDLIRDGNRFSEKITLQHETWSVMMIRRKIITLWKT